MAIEHTTLIEELVQIDTPTLSNAIELLEVRNRISGFADLNMRCLTPELGVLCGSAVTAQAVTMSPEPVQRDTALRNYIRICEELEALPGTGSGRHSGSRSPSGLCSPLWRCDGHALSALQGSRRGERCRHT